MASLRSCFYTGHVVHSRVSPARHRFRYRTFSLCIDLDELSTLNQIRGFSVNRFNLLSFYEKDHGLGQGKLREYINRLLTERGHAHATHRIELLCYPRILGYVFNPLSVYFCYDQQQTLQLVVYEVSNTFGQRHSYLLTVKDCENVLQSCDKKMYVSPFMPIDCRYHFHIKPPQKAVTIAIRQYQADQQPLFSAAFTGQQQPFTSRNLHRLFISHPLMTLKVIAAIHWEALQLWRKRVALQPRNAHPAHSISWQDERGECHYESL